MVQWVKEWRRSKLIIAIYFLNVGLSPNSLSMSIMEHLTICVYRTSIPQHNGIKKLYIYIYKDRMTLLKGVE